MQSVKHSDSIAPNNAIVKNAISKIKQMFEDIEGGEADKDGKPIVNYYFAGKVNIGDVEKIVFVRTRKSDGRANRFYVHEVFTEDEIAKLGSQQTDAALANTSRKYRNASEFYRNIIAKVLNYKFSDEKNPENASSTDKNGPSAAPDGAMEGKRTETDYSDKSDGNGAIFTLNSNASEELKRQVKAMQACVGPFLDQDGAEYARRFKEKYGISIDPDEAKVIAALAISENRSAQQTFSDKFRAKEKEITGTYNSNIIIAESTQQGLKSVEKSDTLNEKGKDKKHLTLPQAAAMLGLSSEDFLIEDEDTDSDIKLSAPGDRVQNIEEVNRKFNDDLDRQQKKATDELFLFRDLPRGSRLDNMSVTAVRQLLEQ